MSEVRAGDDARVEQIIAAERQARAPNGCAKDCFSKKLIARYEAKLKLSNPYPQGKDAVFTKRRESMFRGIFDDAAGPRPRDGEPTIISSHPMLAEVKPLAEALEPGLKHILVQLTNPLQDMLKLNAEAELALAEGYSYHDTKIQNIGEQTWGLVVMTRGLNVRKAAAARTQETIRAAFEQADETAKAFKPQFVKEAV